MQTLLNLHSKGEYGVLRSPNWPYVRDGLKRNLSTVIRYYRRNPTAVKAQHFLVRLLQSITIPFSLTADRYYANVDAAALNISMSLKMTSAIFKGETFSNIFYGGDCTEILIASDETFDPLKAEKNWQNLCPVTVLQHFRSDLGLNLLDGTDDNGESGVAVIKINISMLALQYRCFRMEQTALADGTDYVPLTVQQFVRMYVIPNMLFSHLDVAIFNRMVKLRKGLPIGKAKKLHSFYLLDMDTRADVAIEYTLMHLENKQYEFAGMLKNMLAVTKENMFEVFQAPELAPTRQISWALFMVQLPVAIFLFQYSARFSHAQNKDEVNQIRRALLAFKSDNTLKSALPLELYYEARSEIDIMTA